MFKPFLKWVGGKTQLFQQIYDKIKLNKEIDTYYELFLGGGSTLISLIEQVECENIKIKKFVCSDVNKELINTYNTIKNECEKLVKILEVLRTKYLKQKMIEIPRRYVFKIKLDEEMRKRLEEEIDEKILGEIIDKQKNQEKYGKQYYYYFARQLYNDLINEKNLDRYNKNRIVRAGLFIFLNKTCFRGLYRMNKSCFNVPFGNYENPVIYTKLHLEFLSGLFKKYDVIFDGKSYKQYIGKINRLDMVYLDPPYYPVNEKSFVGYNLDGFNQKEHIRLAKFCHYISLRGCKFLQSNSDVEFNSKIYSKFKKDRILCSRRINSKNPNSNQMEILVYNF
jgi:DNA adenine methylase